MRENEQPGRPAGFGLRVGDLERTAVSVVRSPQHTVVAVALSAAQRRYRGPRSVERSGPAAVALAPMVASNLAMIPDLIIPIEQPRDLPVAEQCDYLRSGPEQELVDDIHRRLGPSIPRHWQQVLDRPRQWLDSMAATSADTWAALGPSWARRQALLDREVARLGAARVRGQTSVLLDNLHRCLRLVDGRVLIKTDGHRQESVDLAGRHLVLVPMLSDPGTVVVNFDRPRVVTISYPVPGLAAAGPPADTDALVALLGPVRAAVLRAVRTPLAIGRLARDLHMAANTATYHCAHLEQAGLLVRERQGQTVQVSITERGRAVVDVMTG